MKYVESVIDCDFYYLLGIPLISFAWSFHYIVGIFGKLYDLIIIFELSLSSF